MRLPCVCAQVLNGYVMLKTEDIPRMSDFDFTPAHVKQNALATLRWMQSNCTGESSTYVLHRSSNDSELKLFDLGDLIAKTEEAKKGLKKGLKKGENDVGQGLLQSLEGSRAAFSLGMLCYRTANSLAKGGAGADAMHEVTSAMHAGQSPLTRDPKGDRNTLGGTLGMGTANDLRRRRLRQLYSQTLSLLDQDEYPLECAKTHEKIADTYIGANCINGSDSDETDDSDKTYSFTHRDLHGCDPPDDGCDSARSEAGSDTGSTDHGSFHSSQQRGRGAVGCTTVVYQRATEPPTAARQQRVLELLEGGSHLTAALDALVKPAEASDSTGLFDPLRHRLRRKVCPPD